MNNDPYVEELENSLNKSAESIIYLENLLNALLTGDMPEKCDLCTALMAAKGRRLVEFERMRKLPQIIGDDAYAS